MSSKKKKVHSFKKTLTYSGNRLKHRMSLRRSLNRSKAAIGLERHSKTYYSQSMTIIWPSHLTQTNGTLKRKDVIQILRRCRLCKIRRRLSAYSPKKGPSKRSANIVNVARLADTLKFRDNKTIRNRKIYKSVVSMCLWSLNRVIRVLHVMMHSKVKLTLARVKQSPTLKDIWISLP